MCAQAPACRVHTFNPVKVDLSTREVRLPVTKIVLRTPFCLKTGYEADPNFAQDGRRTGESTEVGGLWWDGVCANPRVRVRAVLSLRTGIIRSMHEPPTRAPMGFHKTLKAARQGCTCFAVKVGTEGESSIPQTSCPEPDRLQGLLAEFADAFPADLPKGCHPPVM
jgi:hypothetical protein